MPVHGLRNMFRVHILGKEPRYTKKDLDKIASKYKSPLPSCLKAPSWLALYNAFIKAGLSPQRASEETDDRIISYD
jgi:hypothetical protein